MRANSEGIQAKRRYSCTIFLTFSASLVAKNGITALFTNEKRCVQLARENKKFMFSAIRKSARARAYENAIIWLEDAGLILRVFCANTPKRPLKAYLQKKYI